MHAVGVKSVLGYKFLNKKDMQFAELAGACKSIT